MARTRLAILYGGRSAEHQVSVVSARSVMEALDPDRFEVVPIAITREGAWLLPDRSPLELTASGGALPEVEPSGREVAVRPERGLAEAGAGPVDVVFPILHGPFGEDGTVQGLFELADLPYVGSGVLASALAMDKAMAKVVLAAAGLPQAPYLVVPERDWRADPGRVAAEVAERLAYPVFTKPARLGSSMAERSAIRPRYIRNRMRNEVSRASQTHQVPHIGLPQIEPVASAMAVKTAPTGAAARAATSASGCRQIRPTALPSATHR